MGGCGNSPVALVNGVRITEAEFNRRLVRVAGRDTLTDMINRQLIKQMADREGITVSEEELAKQVEQEKARYPSEERFSRFLASVDMAEQEWRESLKMQLVVKKLALKDVKHTDKDLKDFFEQYQDRFALPTRVSLSEIVVASKQDAEEVLAELNKGESSFADLARVYSLSTYTSRLGGKRPEGIPLERVTPEAIRAAAARLPVEQVSDPIFAADQWYIIRVDARDLAREADWEKDKENVKAAYEAFNAKPLPELLKEAIHQAQVQILDPRFHDIAELYTPMPSKMPEFGPEGATPETGETPQEQPAQEGAG